MKRNIIKFCLLFVILIFLFIGCAKKPSDVPLPNGLYYPIGGVPSIDTFSSTEYEDYKYHFSPVESAVFYHDGKEEPIAPDDPRLIQLLNFLAYSNERFLFWQLQGYVEEDEIDQYLLTEAPMLEVFFRHDASSNSEFKSSPRILICGDSFLMFVDTDSPTWPMDDGLMYADRYWPYASVFMDEVDKGNADRSRISFEGWGNEYWLDLLTYAGFTTE